MRARPAKKKTPTADNRHTELHSGGATPFSGGGGGGLARRHGVCWSAAGGAIRPIATYCPSLGPFPSEGGGAHRPLTALCPSSPSLACLSLSTSLSLPLGGCAKGAPGLSLCHCSVSGPHGGGQLPSLLARGGGASPCVTFRLVVVSLRGSGRSPVRPSACCVRSLLSVSRCGRCSCWCRFRVRRAP